MRTASAEQVRLALISLNQGENQMEYFKEIEKMLDAESAVNTVEKNTLAAIEFVPVELARTTLITWTKSNADLIRANLTAAKKVQSYVKDSAEEFYAKLQKAVK